MEETCKKARQLIQEKKYLTAIQLLFTLYSDEKYKEYPFFIQCQIESLLGDAHFYFTKECPLDPHLLTFYLHGTLIFKPWLSGFCQREFIERMLALHAPSKTDTESFIQKQRTTLSFFKSPTLQATLPLGNKLTFIEYPVPKDGDCGFTSLGLKREIVITRLLNSLDSLTETEKKLLLPEIIDEITVSENYLLHWPTLSSDRKEQLQSCFKEYDQSLQRLNRTCSDLRMAILGIDLDKQEDIKTESPEELLSWIKRFPTGYAEEIQKIENRISTFNEMENRLERQFLQRDTLAAFLSSFSHTHGHKFLSFMREDGQSTTGLLELICLKEGIPGICIWQRSQYYPKQIKTIHSSGDALNGCHMLYDPATQHFTRLILEPASLQETKKRDTACQLLEENRPFKRRKTR